MASLPKEIYRFNAIPSKILHRSQKGNTQLHMEKQNPRIAKTILYSKGTSGGITIADFKLYCRATLMKTAWYLHKNRQVDQWN
ncbi:Retrovirus-related Pol polyprotein LINE-1 [Cricetulus griseus]|uniref:Retrovirus-related Pol polyprotein LINE-1 n=1 Tax=Cricetulus griseus TaxID=10029 RepID=G3IA83_CRIGR|nr:Retrovirus-related Pol polyprotein LINE-1 [Cricetulus griseus]